MNKVSQVQIYLIIACVLLVACNKPEDKVQQSRGEVAVVDSLAERQAQALNVVAAYPMEEWGDDILVRIRDKAGAAVSDEVKKRAQERLGAKELKEKRLSLLVELYSADELLKLSEIYRTVEGKSIMRKSSQYDDRLRELAEPLVMEVLSNVR